MGYINRHIIFAVFTILLSTTACNEEPTKSEAIEIGLLFNTWYDSYEEKTDSTDIFRPEGYKEFPPSRFRRRITFNDDGACSWLVLHPADAHYLETGTWKFNGAERLIFVYNNKGEEVHVMKILELNRELLRVLMIKYSYN
ncbi:MULTISPECIES: hypothetical protein [Melioribacter]|nr:hypothetical protein [Melioribacter roseus]